MKPQDTVDQYFKCVRERDIESLMSLYAGDAVFTLPSGKRFQGAAAVRELHQGVFAAASPFPTPTSIITSDASAAAEVEARLPDGTVRRTVNFYHFNNTGRIQKLSVYMQQND